MNYAYLRVSTQDQILENQQYEVQKFASDRGLSIDIFVKEQVSGIKKASSRKLGRLIKQLRPGDVLIVSEISRLSRKMTEIMMIMQKVLDKHVTLYSIKENYSFEDNINSKVLCFAFSIAAEIERDLISQRTKEALAVRRKNGIILGRPKGSGKLSRLSKNDIRTILESESKDYKKICKQYGISISSFYRLRKSHKETA